VNKIILSKNAKKDLLKVPPHIAFKVKA